MQANEKAGEACGYLAGAEARPVGNKQAAVGEAMLAHAVTLALQAKEADPRWTSFATDMSAIGSSKGLPGLKRITAVCAQQSKDSSYYVTHTPNG